MDSQYLTKKIFIEVKRLLKLDPNKIHKEFMIAFCKFAPYLVILAEDKVKENIEILEKAVYELKKEFSVLLGGKSENKNSN